MLSYTKYASSHAIALMDAYHKKNSRFVFYGEGIAEDLTEEQKKELLHMQHGFEATRYKKHRDELEVNPRLSMLEPTVKGHFVPFYPVNEEGERNVHYIFGRSGSGKSYLAKQLSKWYTKLKVKVFIVSPVEDAAYSGRFVTLDELVEVNQSSSFEMQKKTYETAKIKLKYARAKKLDPDLLMQMELAVLDLKPKRAKGETLYKTTERYEKLVKAPSLFIYDDTEVSDQGKLDFLRNKQLLTGRHQHVNIIIINHQANSGNRTRHVINESNMFTFFKPFNRYTSYFLKQYLQFDARMLNKVKELLKSSRRVTVYKNESVLMSEQKMISW